MYERVRLTLNPVELEELKKVYPGEQLSRIISKLIRKALQEAKNDSKHR